MMKEDNSTILGFKGVNIARVDFHSEGYVDPSKELTVNLVPKLFLPEESKPGIEKGAFSIVMELEMTCKDCFTLSISAIGNFKLGPGSKPEHYESLRHVNAPAIMYPYLRSFVSTLTNNIGDNLPGMTLPPRSFGNKLELLEEANLGSEEETS